MFYILIPIFNIFTLSDAYPNIRIFGSSSFLDDQIIITFISLFLYLFSKFQFIPSFPIFQFY